MAAGMSLTSRRPRKQGGAGPEQESAKTFKGPSLVASLCQNGRTPLQGTPQAPKSEPPTGSQTLKA